MRYLIFFAAAALVFGCARVNVKPTGWCEETYRVSNEGERTLLGQRCFDYGPYSLHE